MPRRFWVCNPHPYVPYETVKDVPLECMLYDELEMTWNPLHDHLQDFSCYAQNTLLVFYESWDQLILQPQQLPANATCLDDTLNELHSPQQAQSDILWINIIQALIFFCPIKCHQIYVATLLNQHLLPNFKYFFFLIV